MDLYLFQENSCKQDLFLIPIVLNTFWLRITLSHDIITNNTNNDSAYNSEKSNSNTKSYLDYWTPCLCCFGDYNNVFAGSFWKKTDPFCPDRMYPWRNDLVTIKTTQQMD